MARLHKPNGNDKTLSLFEELGQSVEVCQLNTLTGSSSARKLYLPRRLCEAMRLTKADSHLVAVFDAGIVILVRDTKLLERLRPQVLAARQLYTNLRAKAVAVELEPDEKHGPELGKEVGYL